jgi:ribosome biogenesis GTPase
LYSLEDLGWDEYFQSQIESTTHNLISARVADEQRGAYLLYTANRTLDGIMPGRAMHNAEGREDFPAVGDWVLAEPLPGEDRAVIRRVLERRTKLSRKSSGERTYEQIMAANIDAVFLVASLNAELNLRRIERYLSTLWESGARPVIVLNKADLVHDSRALLARVELVAPAVDILPTSALTGEGLSAMRGYVSHGKTVVLVGSSGVGKSSLVNALMNDDVQTVRSIRNDDKGRHTTTSRQLFMTPSGGLIIDTPGLRSLGLWDAHEGIGQTFSDVEAFANGCNFSDCKHANEPGCAVQQAIEDGELDQRRFESYRKLEREQVFIEGKRDVRIRNAEKKKWKDIQKANRQRMKVRGR